MNMNKFRVPEEIRKMASDAVECPKPVRRKHLRNIARKARREFEAERAVLPREKAVVTKLWVNVRASEDSVEWTEEVRALYERCYDDKARCRPKGVGDRGQAVIDMLPSRCVGLRSQWIRFCGHEVRC